MSKLASYFRYDLLQLSNFMSKKISFCCCFNSLSIFSIGNSFSNDFHALQAKLNAHPGLIKNCFSVDLYLPWSFRALSQVARAWLEDSKSGVCRYSKYKLNHILLGFNLKTVRWYKYSTKLFEIQFFSYLYFLK